MYQLLWYTQIKSFTQETHVLFVEIYICRHYRVGMKSGYNYEMYNLQSRCWHFHASIMLLNPFRKSLDINNLKVAFRKASTYFLIFHIFHQCSDFGNSGNWLITFYWKRRTFFINKKWTFKIILHIIKYVCVSDNLIISYPRIPKCNIRYLFFFSQRNMYLLVLWIL